MTKVKMKKEKKIQFVEFLQVSTAKITTCTDAITEHGPPQF